MDIKIRFGFSHRDESSTPWIAWTIALLSSFAGLYLMGWTGPCSGVDLSRNSSNVTLPLPPPYCPSFLHICLCKSISVNGTEIVENCISGKNRRLSYLITINLVLPQIIMIRKHFTVVGEDRRRFLYTIYFLCLCVLPAAMTPMFWHDCYHRMILFIGLFTWFSLTCAMLRASQAARDRWEARDGRYIAANRN